jgi:hypothetical protein
LVKEIINEAENNMKKTIEVVKKEFASMPPGGLRRHCIDKIMVNYYGLRHLLTNLPILQCLRPGCCYPALGQELDARNRACDIEIRFR